MAPQTPPGTKVIERCQVAPAPGSASTATLPLIFFDYIFLRFHPVQRVFFFELPASRSHFLADHLPSLKLSLSLALREFRPLAGDLVLYPHGGKPELRSTDGDAVAFTLAESHDDFYDLSGNHERDVTRLHPLVPPLLAGDGPRRPVLALQVTLFPDVGVTLGVTVHHAVADGSTSSHFLMTWAALCSLGRKGVSVGCVGAPPSYHRAVVRDRKGLGRIFLDALEVLKEDRRMEAWDLTGRSDVVRATFVLNGEQIQSLGKLVYSKTSWDYCSPYSLATGFIWSCLVKARGDAVGKTEYFGFVTGCRARLDPPAPATYFGNCLGICRVEANRSELVGEDGAVVASAAIWKVIKGLEGGGAAFRGAENWIRDIYWLASMGILTVGGSPKLGLYQVDFGWGRPRKVEMISIETTSAMSIAEAREEQGGGLEFGLVLPRDEMQKFKAVFTDSRKRLSSRG